MTQDNMFENKKLMISFSNIGSNDGKYWLGPEMRKLIKYKSRVVNYNIKNATLALEKLESEIKCHFK
jgi:hypothetical protein